MPAKKTAKSKSKSKSKSRSRSKPKPVAAKATSKTKPKAAPVRRAAPQPKAASPVIGSLAMVTLHVRDAHRALEFYRDTLELPEHEHMLEAGWLEFDTGPLKLGIHADPERVEPGAREPGGTTGFYFGVPDCDAAVATLRQRGVKIVDEPSDMPYGREATFLDPDGNLLALLAPPK